jgi:hypothetical protein
MWTLMQHQSSTVKTNTRHLVNSSECTFTDPNFSLYKIEQSNISVVAMIPS